MELNLKGIVRYDGTDFAGWQIQPDERTVQGELERALSQIAGKRIRVCGASRTDAGVHALGQVFSLHWPQEKPFERLPRSLSQMLGPEIRVERIEPAPADFDARKSARAKRYAYTFACQKERDPFWARYAWAIPWDVPLDRLESLLPRMEGEHDFAGFQSSGSPASCTVRTVHCLRLQRGGVVGPIEDAALFRIEFVADGFLYRMVRNITGTLIDIARGYRPESWLEERLASPGPFQGLSAPARGLALVEVYF